MSHLVFYAEPDAFMIYPIYTSPDVYAHNSNHLGKPCSSDDYTLYTSHDTYVLFCVVMSHLVFHAEPDAYFHIYYIFDINIT